MNQLDLKGRVAIVTGGAQGIGYSTAQRMLASGASLVLWDMDAARLAQAVTELSALGPVSGTVVELTDEAAVAGATSAALALHGRIDILINNAGITGGNGPTWTLDPAVWRRVLEVNLVAPYLTCRALVPQMIRQGYGRIVNIASVAGKEGNPNASHYSASKAGLIALTKSLGKELATLGVLVNAVAPAAARTAIFDQMAPEHIAFMLGKIPMGRLVTVDEVAALVACWRRRTAASPPARCSISRAGAPPTDPARRSAAAPAPRPAPAPPAWPRPPRATSAPGRSWCRAIDGLSARTVAPGRWCRPPPRGSRSRRWPRRSRRPSRPCP